LYSAEYGKSIKYTQEFDLILIYGTALGWLILVTKGSNLKQCAEATYLVTQKVDENQNLTFEEDFQLLETIAVISIPHVNENTAQEIANLNCVDEVREEGVLIGKPKVLRSN